MFKYFKKRNSFKDMSVLTLKEAVVHYKEDPLGNMSCYGIPCLSCPFKLRKGSCRTPKAERQTQKAIKKEIKRRTK